MTVRIYEFAKGFQETQRNGLWVSGGFASPIARSNYQDQLPEPIQNAVIGKLFEIPKRYRPNPGAEALINNGCSDKIAKPDFKSIALIAREIDDYCVLAVATSQIDDTMRDLVVGYQYFWLDVKPLIGQMSNQQLPDGILILLNWWLNNGRPCFDMNPECSTTYTYSQPTLYYKNIGTPETYSKNPIFQELLDKAESDYPPFIVDANQDRILINSTESINGISSLEELHYLAIKANQDYDNCPLAWAWNIRGLGSPREATKQSSHPGDFAAIYCADSEALKLISEQKQLIPKKGKKSTIHDLSSSPKSSNSNNEKTSVATVTETRNENTALGTSTKPGTPTDPDSLMNIQNKIEKDIESYVKSLDKNQLEEVLKSYIKSESIIQKHLKSSLTNKNNCYKDINNITVITEMRYIYLLVILINKEPEQCCILKKFRQKDEVTYFLNNLLENIRKLKKASSAHNSYSKIESRIVRLLKPYSHLQSFIEQINLSNLYLPNPIEWLIQLFQPSPDNASQSESETPEALSPDIVVRDHVDPTSAPTSVSNHHSITHSDTIKSPRLKLFFILAILVLLSLILGIFMPPPNLPFQDIKNHWASKYIQALAQKKVITVDDDNYRPDSVMKRVEFATLLTKAFEVPKSSSTTSIFRDVKTNYWGYNAIQDVYSSGFFTKSIDAQFFYPEQPITRLEILQTLVKALKLSANDTQALELSFYQDENKITTNEARKDIILATKAGLVINYSNPCRLEPDQSATRAEVAAMLYQALVKAGKVDTIDFPESPQLNLEHRICRLQQLEASSDKHANEELTKARKDLIKWMKEGIEPAITVLKQNNYTEEEKKSARQTINSSYSYLKSLIPDFSWADGTSKLPKSLNLEKDNDNESVKNLKETLKLVGFDPGVIDKTADDMLKRAVENFQSKNLSEEDIVNNPGLVGPKTWKALTQTFKDAHLIVAYDHIIKGLETGENKSEIVQKLKNCQKLGPLGYVSCVK